MRRIDCSSVWISGWSCTLGAAKRSFSSVETSGMVVGCALVLQLDVGEFEFFEVEIGRRDALS